MVLDPGHIINVELPELAAAGRLLIQVEEPERVACAVGGHLRKDRAG